jgi:hypothetical protein
VEAMLRRLDYRILRIGKSLQGKLGHLQPIQTIGIHGDISMSDYVLCPQEDVDRVLTVVNAGRSS